MSRIKIAPNDSGTGIFTIESPNSNTNRTITLPDNAGNFLTTGSPGAILQVKSAFKDDVATTTSTSFADISGLSVSITPSSATNKCLIMVTLGSVGNLTNTTLFNIVRDSTAIAQPSGGTAPASINEYNGSSNNGDVDTCSIIFLDSPATTSAITYKVQWRVDNGTGYLNRHTGNSNYRSVSNIVVMEVVA